jgi:hypothetical protein
MRTPRPAPLGPSPKKPATWESLLYLPCETRVPAQLGWHAAFALALISLLALVQKSDSRNGMGPEGADCELLEWLIEGIKP